MENATKALYIAAAVLLAVMLVVGITYVISSMSTVQEQDMLRVKAEQAAKFNAEYDVFKKSLMYGTDIISVLNKATSNNEKYVVASGQMAVNYEGNTANTDVFLNDHKYEKEYLIDIIIEFDSTDSLSGSVKTYLTSSTGKDRLLTTYDPSNPLNTMREVFKVGEADSLISDLYNIAPTKDILEAQDVPLDSNVIPTDKIVHLFDMGTWNNGNGKYKICSLVELVRRESKKLDVIVRESSLSNPADVADEWTYSVFSTATKALKEKKFKFVEATYCEDVENSAYGRITSMKFKEVVRH